MRSHVSAELKPKNFVPPYTPTNIEEYRDKKSQTGSYRFIDSHKQLHIVTERFTMSYRGIQSTLESQIEMHRVRVYRGIYNQTNQRILYLPICKSYN